MELKLCPFCGWKELFVNSAVGEHWVRCTQCDASTKMRSTADAAIEEWNRREYPDLRNLRDRLQSRREGYVRSKKQVYKDQHWIVDGNIDCYDEAIRGIEKLMDGGE